MDMFFSKAAKAFADVWAFALVSSTGFQKYRFNCPTFVAGLFQNYVVWSCARSTS